MNERVLLVLAIVFSVADSSRRFSYLFSRKNDDLGVAFTNGINRLVKILPTTAKQLAMLSTSLSPTSQSLALKLQHRAINDTLENAFSELMFTFFNERLKHILVNGSDQLDMEPMDPMTFDQIAFDRIFLDDSYDVRLTDVKITGLSGFLMKEFTPKLSELKFGVNIVIPTIVVEADYAVNGTLLDVFDVCGTGHGIIAFNEVQFDIWVKLAVVNDSRLSIRSADTPFTRFKSLNIVLVKDTGKKTVGKPNPIVGPMMFWLLSDHIAERLGNNFKTIVNDAMHAFELPPNFKPIKTKFALNTRRNIKSAGTRILRRLLPAHVTGLVNQLMTLKNQMNLPVMLDTIRSTFRAKKSRKTTKFV